MASGVGTATINFGATPGSTNATLAITGQTSIASGAHIEAWIQGDSTADHNAYEHLVILSRLVSLAGLRRSGGGHGVHDLRRDGIEDHRTGCLSLGLE